MSKQEIEEKQITEEESDKKIEESKEKQAVKK